MIDISKQVVRWEHDGPTDGGGTAINRQTNTEQTTDRHEHMKEYASDQSRILAADVS